MSEQEYIGAIIDQTGVFAISASIALGIAWLLGRIRRARRT